MLNCFLFGKKYWTILSLVISKAVLLIASLRWVIYRPMISTQEQYRPMMSHRRLQITHSCNQNMCVCARARMCILYIENIYYMERFNIGDKNYMKIKRNKYYYSWKISNYSLKIVMYNIYVITNKSGVFLIKI